MEWLKKLSENSVAFIGVLRALSLAVLTFAPTLWTSDQLDAVFYALGLLLPFVSLLFTGVSSAKHAEEIQVAYETIPEGAQPDA